MSYRQKDFHVAQVMMYIDEERHKGQCSTWMHFHALHHEAIMRIRNAYKTPCWVVRDEVNGDVIHLLISFPDGPRPDVYALVCATTGDDNVRVASVNFTKYPHDDELPPEVWDPVPVGAKF